MFYSFLQETFDAGLAAFEQEGIQSITQLKDQLLTANHEQTSAIIKRHDDVMGRYCLIYLFHIDTSFF